jgi:anaphase-promoting complex subunit 4
LLAIAWSDGYVRLVSADNNKIVHQIGSEVDKTSPVSCLGWGMSHIGGQAPEEQSEHRLNDILLVNEEWDRDSNIFKENSTDLPRELALLDTESALPKLSVLPTLGNE